MGHSSMFYCSDTSLGICPVHLGEICRNLPSSASLPGSAERQCRASRRSHPKGKANGRSWSNSPWLPQKLLGLDDLDGWDDWLMTG